MYINRTKQRKQDEKKKQRNKFINEQISKFKNFTENTSGVTEK